mmetsp:Transcript_23501/g.24133  ORF Transcript_23501/g.24133 Transcript_23501/m.24133 type:complete len:239 (+) Transcript_23501:92-808(+)
MCEELHGCKKLGEYGCDIFHKWRIFFMLISAFLSFLIFLLTCVSLAGASEDDTNVENCNWAYAEYTEDSKDYTAYVGLKRFVVSNGNVDSSSSTTSNGFNWADCSDSVYDFCSDCEFAGDSTLKATALAFIVSIPPVITSFIRISAANDTNANKMSTTIFCSLGILLYMISMGQFGKLCYEKLPSDRNYIFGPGFGAAAACFVFQIFVLIIHVSTPVRKGEVALAKEEDNQDDEDNQA